MVALKGSVALGMRGKGMVEDRDWMTEEFEVLVAAA